MNAARALAGAALVAFAALAACGSTFTRPSGEPATGPYESLSAAQRERLVAARAAAERGDFATAIELARAVAAEQPDQIAVGALAQDLELQAAPLLERGVALARMRTETQSLAEQDPSPARLVLEARLLADPEEAHALLEQALALDDRCAWARYGLAHVAAERGNWTQAEQDLEEALAIDPFLAPARRMQAGMLARSGRTRDAIAACKAWLEDTAGDPLVDGYDRIGVELDLATLYVLDGASDDALDVLGRIRVQGSEDVRVLCIRAAAAQGDGRIDQSLAAAREGTEIDPHALLPWVQIATLQESWLDDPAGARTTWARILAETEQSQSLSTLLVAMRARVELERARRADTPPPGSAP